jgi:spore maturation protein CgeB
MIAEQQVNQFVLHGKPISVERHLAASGELTLLVTGEDGRRRSYHSQMDPRREARQQLSAFLGGARSEGPWVFIGTGLGYLLDELEQIPEKGLVCIECHAMLTDGDVAESSNVEVTSLVGLSTQEVIAKLGQWRSENGSSTCNLLINPAALHSFPTYYQPIIDSLEADQKKSKSSAPLLKSARCESCYLLVDTGYFLTSELVHALEAEGHRPILLRLPLNNGDASRGASAYGAFLHNLIEAVKYYQPDMLLTVNHLGFDADGLLTDLLRRLHLPALVWYVDSPRYIFRNRQANLSPWVGAFVWDKSYQSWLRQIGFTHVHYLPLATDPSIFSASPAGDNHKLSRRLVFVGDSMKAIVHKAIHKLPAEMVREFTSDPTSAISRIADQFIFKAQDQREAPWDILDQVLVEHKNTINQGQSSSFFSSEETRLDFESALSLLATRKRRTDFIKSLSQWQNLDPLIIYGDQHWSEILCSNGGSSKPPAEIHPPTDYYRELPEIYQRAGAVINLTGLQMPTALNQRCYDVPAAGGFLLTDQQEALCEQFEPQLEMVTFSSAQELVDRWTFYKNNADSRQEVAQRGRERVLKAHTYRHRIREMLETAKSWFA